jgi:hypothetical protein
VRVSFYIKLLCLADATARETRTVCIEFPIFKLERIRSRVLGAEEGAENHIGGSNREIRE